MISFLENTDLEANYIIAIYSSTEMHFQTVGLYCHNSMQCPSTQFLSRIFSLSCLSPEMHSATSNSYATTRQHKRQLQPAR